MILKIKVKYRGKWYYVTGVEIDPNGKLYFGSHYLHGGEQHGVIDTEYIEEIKYSIKSQEDKNVRNNS